GAPDASARQPGREERLVARQIAIDGVLDRQRREGERRLEAGQGGQVLGADRLAGEGPRHGAPQHGRAGRVAQRDEGVDLGGHALAPPLADGRHVRRHLGPELAERIALEDEPRPRAVPQRLGVVGRVAPALIAARAARVAGELDAVAAEDDVGREQPHIDGLAEVPRGDGVLVAIDPHEALAVHGRHPVEPVRRGGRPQRAERLPLLGQEFPRDLPVCLRDLAVLLRTPGSALRAISRVPRTASVRLYFRRAAKKTRRMTSVPSGTHASPQSTWRNSPASPSKRITGAAAAARTRFRPATKRYQLAALAVYGVV